MAEASAQPVPCAWRVVDAPSREQSQRAIGEQHVRGFARQMPALDQRRPRAPQDQRARLRRHLVRVAG